MAKWIDDYDAAEVLDLTHPLISKLSALDNKRIGWRNGAC